MLIKSFLAMPKPNSLNLLISQLKKYPNCEITSPRNSQKVLVIVMENKNQEEEETFIDQLHQCSALEQLVLVSSFNE